jgi:hypothetical protein
MTKRMLELSVMMEMSQQFPVPPEQIIEKLELAETEKQRWLEYIDQQQAAQQQQQEALARIEMQFKDREIKVDEEKNMLEFMVDMAKIKQMSEKDEKKMISDFQKMSIEEQNNLMQYVAQMAAVAQQAIAAKQQAASATKTPQGGTKK